MIATASDERADLHVEERRSYAEFASWHSEEAYRTRLADLYAVWRDSNERFFDGKLELPHLAFGRTAPRSLGHCTRNTDYGGKVQILLNARLVFGTNPDWVVHPWEPERPRDPADRPTGEGTKAFIDDLLLRYSVQQYVLEVLGVEERGYRGFGPLFTEEANRVGSYLGVNRVIERHRKPEDDIYGLARGWPHCVRPGTHYENDVTEQALALACCPARPPRRPTALPSAGLLELIESRLARGMTEQVRQMIRRHLEWVQRYQRSRPPPLRRAECGKEDVDGRPLGEVTFDRSWLDWNGGTVLRMAQGIFESGSFWDLPILGDALTDAGCNEERILRHLYHPMEHSRRCWVLRILLALRS